MIDRGVLDFITVMGATVVEVEPGDRCVTRRCADYERSTKTVTVCAQLCPGRRTGVWEKVLTRI